MLDPHKNVVYEQNHILYGAAAAHKQGFEGGEVESYLKKNQVGFVEQVMTPDLLLQEHAKENIREERVR